MIELARSLTILAAAPRPRFSLEGVSIAAPFSHARHLAALPCGNVCISMLGACRHLGKAERQRLLAGIVARKRVGTQLELAQALAAAGCAVTQATISRDIRELGLEKTHDALGRPRYELPDRGRPPARRIRRTRSPRC